jgi:hypothetical protein
MVLPVAFWGCSTPRDAFIDQAPENRGRTAIIGVAGIDARLDLVDGKPFETHSRQGVFYRVHVKPGSHVFDVVALKDAGAVYQTVADSTSRAEILADVKAGHVYGFRSEETPQGRRFWIVDLGTDADPGCFKPRAEGMGYISQDCVWP